MVLYKNYYILKTLGFCFVYGTCGIVLWNDIMPKIELSILGFQSKYITTKNGYQKRHKTFIICLFPKAQNLSIEKGLYVTR